MRIAIAFLSPASAAFVLASCLPTAVQTSVIEGVVLPSACYASGNPTERASGDAGGPASAAMPTRCANDAECSSGARCDTAISPPTCIVLYCLPEGNPCAHAEECVQGLQCRNHLCNPCNVCGDRCEVDFATDPDHCGTCENAVPRTQICLGGEAACPADKPTLCGTTCVDILTDESNCGACGKAAPPGGSCVGGDLRCSGKTSDDKNCGGCGRACRKPSSCDTGSCTVAELQVGGPNDTCDAVCASLGTGFSCRSAQGRYGSRACRPGDGCGTNALSCPLPQDSYFVSHYAYTSIECECVYTP